MELHCSKTHMPDDNTDYCFVPIWNYIALKLNVNAVIFHLRFVPIWNYIALKRNSH